MACLMCSIAIQAKLRLAKKRPTLAIILDWVKQWFQQKNCLLKVEFYKLIWAPVIDKENRLIAENIEFGTFQYYRMSLRIIKLMF